MIWRCNVISFLTMITLVACNNEPSYDLDNLQAYPATFDEIHKDAVHYGADVFPIITHGYLNLSDNKQSSPIIEDKSTEHNQGSDLVIYLDVEKREITSCDKKSVVALGFVEKIDEKILLKDVYLTAYEDNLTATDYKDLGVSYPYDKKKPIECKPKT